MIPSGVNRSNSSKPKFADFAGKCNNIKMSVVSNNFKSTVAENVSPQGAI